jgi:transposase
MSAKEVDRLTLVREIEQGRISRGEAAGLLQVSERQLRRILRRYEKEGPRGLVHCSRDRPSNRRIAPEMRAVAVPFIKEKDFHDYGPTRLSETLLR